MNTVVKLSSSLVFAFFTAASIAATTPYKSPNDDRQYSSYSLKNKLQVLLVSDAGSTKAAAALDVNVGSGDDPEDRNGLAHFLEHMLFLGTEKYPNSGEYQEFISAHGGGHNAYTSYEHTNYFFDVDAQYLEPALDRFSQFFTAPLFNAEFVGREINAVESEYRSKLKEDSRRSLDVFKEIINPEHPFAKLSVGNVQTLLNDPELTAADLVEKEDPNGGLLDEANTQRFEELRQELLGFYAQHYAADKMTLVVIGPQSIKELKRWVSEKFGAIPSTGTVKGPKAVPGKNVAPPPLFTPGFLPRLVSLQPEKDSRSLGVTFPIPRLKPHYLSKPDQYIGNIIGHEGEGSLLSYLKSRGWAEGLSAGAGFEHKGGATFNVSISLTQSGLQHQDDILNALFQLIEQIRDGGIEKWRQKEQKNILATAFRFQEQGRAIGYASQLANKLHDYPAKEVLRGDYRLTRYKPSLLKEMLDHLRPDNALVTVMARGRDHEKQSHWYATPYSVESIPTPTLERWRTPSADLADSLPISLPEPNPFLAENFELQKSNGDAGDRPILITEASSAEVWWNPATEFAVPKAQLFFNIRSELAGGSAKQAALSQLLAAVVSDSLNELSYPALLAGINFQVRRHMHGLSIRVGGYSEKQALLLEKIAKALSFETVDEQRLGDLHTELLRRWSNDKKRLPYQILFSSLNEAVVSKVWPAAAQASALPAINAEEFLSYARGFMHSATVQSMAVGNVSSEEAIDRARIIESVVSCASNAGCDGQKTKVARLDAKDTLSLSIDVEHADSALIHYFQAPDQSPASRANAALTAQIIKSEYFQQLRTEQQLGYAVFATALPLLDVPGLALIVQSPGNSVADIHAANQAFLRERSEVLIDEKSANFKQYKEALLSELREKPKSIAEQAETYWADLALGYESFDRRSDLIVAVEALDFEEWRTFFDSAFEAGFLLWAQGDRALGALTINGSTVMRSGESTSTAIDAQGHFVVGKVN
ncbi:MAG: insulinase family protein [Pseudomonadales bacterium]